MDIQAYVKQHPKEVAGIAGAGAIVAIVVSAKFKTKSTATPANSIGTDIPTAYVINTGGQPIDTSNLSPYVPTTGPVPVANDGAGAPPPSYTSNISSILGLSQGSGSLVDQNALSIGVPVDIMNSRKCPSGYHFYPQIGRGGTSINWVCKSSHGQSPSILATTPK